MIQAKFTLDESQVEFVQLFQRYGFKDRSAVVRAALDRLQSELELDELQKSAAMYAEVYESDNELQELTQAALQGWPE